LWQGKTESILRLAPNAFCKPDAESALQFQAVQFPSQPRDRQSGQLLLPQLHRRHLFLSQKFFFTFIIFKPFSSLTDFPWAFSHNYLVIARFLPESGSFHPIHHHQQ